MKTGGAAGLLVFLSRSLFVDPRRKTGLHGRDARAIRYYYSPQFVFIREIRVSQRWLRLHHSDRSGMTTIFSDSGFGRAAS